MIVYFFQKNPHLQPIVIKTAKVQPTDLYPDSQSKQGSFAEFLNDSHVSTRISHTKSKSLLGVSATNETSMIINQQKAWQRGNKENSYNCTERRKPNETRPLCWEVVLIPHVECPIHHWVEGTKQWTCPLSQFLQRWTPGAEFFENHCTNPALIIGLETSPKEPNFYLHCPCSFDSLKNEE